jgi:hypothetical protein
MADHDGKKEQEDEGVALALVCGEGPRAMHACLLISSRRVQAHVFFCVAVERANFRWVLR